MFRLCIAVRSIVRIALTQKLFTNRGSPDCLVNVVPADTVFFVERLLLHLDNMLFYLMHCTGELVIKKLFPPTAKYYSRNTLNRATAKISNSENFQSYGILYYYTIELVV